MVVYALADQPRLHFCVGLLLAVSEVFIDMAPKPRGSKKTPQTVPPPPKGLQGLTGKSSGTGGQRPLAPLNQPPKAGGAGAGGTASAAAGDWSLPHPGGGSWASPTPAALAGVSASYAMASAGAAGGPGPYPASGVPASYATAPGAGTGTPSTPSGISTSYVMVPEGGKGEGRVGGPESSAAAEARKPVAAHHKKVCIDCGTEDHWRHMEVERSTVYASGAAASRADTAQEKNDLSGGQQREVVKHRCVACVAKREGITPQEALRNFCKKPRTDKAEARVAAFTLGMQKQQKKFDMMQVDAEEGDDDDDAAMSVTSGATTATTAASKQQAKKERRRMVCLDLSTVQEAFSPILDILKEKKRDMELAQKKCAIYLEWMNNPENDLSEDKRQGLIRELALEEALHKQRAFATCSDQAAMIRAADYMDEWWATAKSTLRTYYVCAAGGAYPCNTVITAPTWNTLHPDPLATGQRWYCKCCYAKYRVKFGVLCEMMIDGQLYYCKAETPPHDVNDAKNMHLERTFKPKGTAREFLANLPDVVPFDKERLMASTQYEGHYKLKVPLEQFPNLSWDQIYTFVE